MAKEVVISELAEMNYESILTYLYSDWGINVANNFVERFEEVCGHLEKNTSIYPFANKNANSKMRAYRAECFVFQRIRKCC